MASPDPPAGGFGRAAETSLRFLLIVAAAVVVAYALIQLRLVVLPVVGAILIAPRSSRSPADCSASGCRRSPQLWRRCSAGPPWSPG